MGRLGDVVAIAFAAVALSPGATWPGPPSASPQTSSLGPPPAWVETHTNSLWLGQSSSCWRRGTHTVCADDFTPQLRTDTPVLRVRRGATVRIHFRFAPRAVSATMFRGPRETLRSARVVEWRPPQSGLFIVSALAARGDASYVARVRLF